MAVQEMWAQNHTHFGNCNAWNKATHHVLVHCNAPSYLYKEVILCIGNANIIINGKTSSFLSYLRSICKWAHECPIDFIVSKLIDFKHVRSKCRNYKFPLLIIRFDIALKNTPPIYSFYLFITKRIIEKKIPNAVSFESKTPKRPSSNEPTASFQSFKKQKRAGRKFAV